MRASRPLRPDSADPTLDCEEPFWRAQLPTTRAVAACPYFTEAATINQYRCPVYRLRVGPSDAQSVLGRIDTKSVLGCWLHACLLSGSGVAALNVGRSSPGTTRRVGPRSPLPVKVGDRVATLVSRLKHVVACRQAAAQSPHRGAAAGGPADAMIIA